MFQIRRNIPCIQYEEVSRGNFSCRFFEEKTRSCAQIKRQIKGPGYLRISGAKFTENKRFNTAVELTVPSFKLVRTDIHARDKVAELKALSMNLAVHKSGNTILAMCVSICGSQNWKLLADDCRDSNVMFLKSAMFIDPTVVKSLTTSDNLFNSLKGLAAFLIETVSVNICWQIVIVEFRTSIQIS